MDKVAILGAGPTGLLAAHAAASRGLGVMIYSKNRKSHLYGAQYLHEEIPGIDLDPPVDIGYLLQGSITGYRRKVYGDRWSGSVSAEEYKGDHKAWNIRQMYDILWDKYQDLVVDLTLGPDRLPLLLEENDLVFNTIPKQSLCINPRHTFAAKRIWAVGDVAPDSPRLPFPCDNNTILCNGYDEPEWYRLSHVFGYRTVEWPHAHPGAARVLKPLYNTCDCWENELINIGRYGEWTKGILVHQAYHKVIKEITNSCCEECHGLFSQKACGHDFGCPGCET